MRHFPSEKKESTSPTTLDQLDPLLQFESEDRSVRRLEQTAVSVRRSAVPLPAFRAEAVARPQRKIEARPVARSKARRSLWPVVTGAMCGSVLAAVILVQMNALSLMSSQNPVVPPPPAATPVQTAAPVETSTDVTPFVPVTFVEEKKPFAPLSVELRSPAVGSPAPPLSTARRPGAGTRFYGSLAIDSVPVSARAFINGEPIGVTPLVLTEVPVGSRAIRLEADDHTPWYSTARVVAGQQTRVIATLSPAR
jgi:hypothetical protein